MKSEKTYPFSVRKHAHDIEFYRNRLFNTMHDMEMGEIPMDTKRYDRIYDGKQIGLAKKIVIWASETRAQSCIERGRLDLLKYC